MLYEGLIRFLRDAQAAMVDKQRARAGERLSRSHAIINHLLSSLDAKHAPELCQNLQSLYVFCGGHLIKANLEQDPAKIGDVIRLLTPLRDAWVTAVAQVSAPPR
jgi:flagellar protein FliS